MLAKISIALVLAAIIAPAQTTRKLVWSDEFDGPAIDRTKWTFETGGHGWGNNELEFYTDRPVNARIEDGSLVIEARREDHGGRRYTSARLLTRGRFSRTYGRFEARIRLPYGQGIWPAFWMLGDSFPTAGWPRCGEIDIMEYIGPQDAGTVYGTLHTAGASGANGLGGRHTLAAGAKPSDAYHVYAVEWEPEEIRWYFDGVQYKTVRKSDLPANAVWSFDKPFHLLLNVAVGGNWPKNPDDSTQFPQFMRVDYVRVYDIPAAKP